MIRPIKAKRKATLKAACTSKKPKFINDLLIAEQERAIELKNKWFVKRRRAPLEMKAQMKKAVDAKKTLVDKEIKLNKKRRIG